MPIPKHQQGDIFSNRNDELDRAHRIACIGHNGGPYDTGQLARGYFAAAHQLLLWDAPRKQIEKRPLEEQDVLDASIDLKVYPILFSYRQGIELSLKHLLFQIPRIFGENLKAKDLQGHSLEGWWTKLTDGPKGYLNRLHTEASARYAGDTGLCRFLQDRLDPNGLANVGSIILEIHGIDPKATAFRYALDNEDKLPLGDRKYIILDKVYFFMLPVSTWLAEVIYRSDELAGPTPGLEPNWLYLLEPASPKGRQE